jgi:glucose-6-phosphate 1-epimerase
MDLQTLTDTFAIPGVLTFSATEHGLLRADVSTPACSARLYLHGAHLTAWQPVGQRPVLFLSERSPLQPDKAIRGGVPVIFPWFGARTASPSSPRTDGPAHGFARLLPWQLAFAAMAGGDLHLTLTLGPTETSRSLGYDHFHVAMEFTLGHELRMKLTVGNQGTAPLHFEEALHTYLQVSDARHIALHGLQHAEFLDKTDHFLRKTQAEPTLRLTTETDQLYLNTTEPVTLDDPAWARRITVAKSGSASTVIWNPWAELSARMADMTPDNWTSMTCVEAANANQNAVTLGPGGVHTMEARITVEDLPA